MGWRGRVRIWTWTCSFGQDRRRLRACRARRRARRTSIVVIGASKRPRVAIMYPKW